MKVTKTLRYGPLVEHDTMRFFACSLENKRAARDAGFEGRGGHHL